MANLKIWTIVGILYLTGISVAQYEPTWESLDSRPLPAWYDEAKIGIFIHWGLFSVPSFGSEWFWAYWRGHSASYVDYMKKNYPPNFTYQDFGREFTAEFYKPEDWAELFKASGARYVVLTSKHHEGYTLWPSKFSFGWNSKDLGPNRDLLGDLAAAVRNKTDLKFGLYHSLYEWYHPLYKLDKQNKFETQYFVNQKTIPELHELVNNYLPEVIWSDGDWEGSDTYWASKEFLAWLYNQSPVKDTVVVNDRWGPGIPCKHGDFYTCKDRFNPGVLQPHKWESCMTIDKLSWGYRRNAKLSDYLTTDELVEKLAMTISCGGNFLMNIGPTKDGMIPIIFEERLRDIGKWLEVNGEAIYQTKPWAAQNDTMTKGVWYTMKGNYSSDSFVYAIVLDWPSSGVLSLEVPVLSEKSKITMLGVTGPLTWTQEESQLNVEFPNKATVATDWAWTLKMTHVTGIRNTSLVNLVNYKNEVISLDGSP
ncbi:alpha-L-fucosidase [Anabrus simplex]|uniref:alpha-L-fucosidase n=1 Tax=Anabrus simplex TaxID=316456 RepID=UPI0035A29EF1